MLQYGIKQPLRFYQKLEHQNRYRKGAAAKVFKLLAPTNRLLPFQLKRAATLLPIQSIKYVSVVDGSSTELLASLDSGELQTFAFQTYDYLVHFGIEDLGLTMPEGEYYLEVTDSVNTWYSEVIQVTDFDADDLTANSCVVTKLTYYDTCDVADIFYRTQAFGGPQYKNIVYLDVDIGKPEYDYNEEGDEDGEGRFEADYKRLEKQYLLQGVFPEYMVDALTLIPLHIGKTGVVEVLTQRGYAGEVDRITVSPQWQGDLGLWALTDILFSTEFVVKANCCDALDVPVTGCLRNYTRAEATVTTGSVDYLAFQYTDAVTGNKVDLLDGQRILATVSGGTELRTYDAANSQYVTVGAPAAGSAVQDENLARLDGETPVTSAEGTLFVDRYVFYSNGQPLYTTAVSIFTDAYDQNAGQRLLTGQAFTDSLVSVYVTTGTDDVLVATLTGAEFNANGAYYSTPAGATGVYIESVGLSCVLGTSATSAYTFAGVGSGSIGSTFAVG